MSTATLNPNQNANASPPVDDDPWSMEVPAPGAGGDYVLCPTGNHQATIVGVFDIGTHNKTNKDGETKPVRELVLVYELAKKRPDGKPFFLTDRFTFSMHEKSNFFKFVTNVTGKKYKSGESFRPPYLLGGPVMVNVTHTTSGDKTYHNVSAVSQFPEGFPPPQAVQTPIAWSVRGKEAFPANADWLPYVFGSPIKALAEASSEAKDRDIPF